MSDKPYTAAELTRARVAIQSAEEVEQTLWEVITEKDRIQILNGWQNAIRVEEREACEKLAETSKGYPTDVSLAIRARASSSAKSPPEVAKECEHHWRDYRDGTGYCINCGQQYDGGRPA